MIVQSATPNNALDGRLALHPLGHLRLRSRLGCCFLSIQRDLSDEGSRLGSYSLISVARNFVRYPEIRYLPGESPVAKFTIRC